MNKVLLSFSSLMLISTLSFSQTINASPPTALDSLNEIYTVVDKEAKFPGSTKDWEKYLLKNLKIDMPVRNGAPDGNYLVITTFKVAIDGKITDINPETKLGYGMEEEVIRIIKKCPNWEPALRYGRKVNSQKRQKITFIVATK